MLSFEKISSKSSGTYNSSSRNVVEFSIPEGQVYDLSKSYVAFTTQITATPVAGEPAGCVHNVSLKYAPGQCLVKNCSLSTARTGTVEDIQNVNVINTNLSFLNDNHSVLEYQPVLNGTDHTDEYGNHQSIFRNLQHTQDSSSRQPQLAIKLSELYGVGGFRRYPSYMVGSTSLRLELETDPKCLQEVHRYHGATTIALNDVAAPDDRDKVITTTAYDSHSDAGLWVGESIEISYTDGLNPGTHKCKITALTRVAGNAQASTITFTPDIAAGALTAITAVEVSADSLAYEITEANLNMVAVASPLSSKAQDELKKGVDFGFQSWEREADNMTAIPYYDRNFYVAPNVEAVCMCSVDADLKTSLTDLADYRVSINGVDTTTEPIQPKGPLQKYKAMATGPALGVVVRRLDDIPDMVVERMPPSQGQKRVQVRVNATAGNNLPVRQVHLFKRVARVLSVSSKAVQVK